jgi:autotransporter-associated beta strand protein
VNSDSNESNGIAIGTGRTLTVTGNLTVGFNSSPAANTTTRLAPTGLGALNVTGSIFQVGGSTNSGFGNAATLDMSGLSNFVYNNSIGTFRVGDATNASSAGTGSSTVILANQSTITAQTFTMNSPTSAAHAVQLGRGLTIINADTIQIGATSNRSPGSMNFFDTTGSLKVRATDGLAPANMTVAYGSTTTAVHNNSSVDLSGHSADLLLGTLQIGGRTASGGAASTGTFSFDAGNLSASSVTVGLRAAGTATGNVTGIMNLAGGTVTIGNGELIVGRNSSSTTGFNTTGTINISGGSVSVQATSGVSIRLADSTASGGTANGILNLTGGSLTVAGDVLRGANTGTSNATVLLSGGTLNMNGHDLGAAGNGVVNFIVESGTLQNIATINGTGGLTKTSAGTLTLAGSNTYTGATTISAGRLALAANNALPATAVSLGSATLDAATFTDTLGTLNVTGASTINLGSGALLSFANSSSITWAGTLTITGNFVSGSSIRFGTTSTALTSTQLAKISSPGFSSFALNASGFLTASATSPASSYASWANTNASSTSPTQDQDNDGVSNAVEYVLGGSSATNDISKLPSLSISAGNIVFSFQRAQSSINPSTSLTIQVSPTLQAWPDNYNVGIDTASSSAGVTVTAGSTAGYDTVTLSIPRAPDVQKFIRLQVTISP